MGASKANKLNVSASIAKAQGKAAMILVQLVRLAQWVLQLWCAWVSAANSYEPQCRIKRCLHLPVEGERMSSNNQTSQFLQTAVFPNFAGLNLLALKLAKKTIFRAYCRPVILLQGVTARAAGLDIADPETGGIRQDLAEKQKSFGVQKADNTKPQRHIHY